MSVEIKIDTEFKALIPQLLPEELRQLEMNLIADGCKSPLLVWKGKGILLDGHNRYEICANNNIDFDTDEIDLATRDEAKEWIIKNQFGRRNLSAYQRGELALLLAPIFEKRAKENQRTRKGNQAGSTCQNSDKLIDTKKELASISNISHDTMAKVKVIAERGSEEVKESLRAGKTSIHQEYTKITRDEKERKRESKRADNAKKAAAVSDPLKAGEVFSALLIDPPWDWGDEGDCDQLGRAKPDYATMTISELMALPVAKLCAKDSHLYLWITNRSLPKGFALLEAWGYRYITMLTWPKTHFGMGNYFRGQTEQILFGVRGSMPLKRKDAATLLPQWKRGKAGHSSKPEEIYDFIESCSPGPYLEMFSRTKRSGWSSWGADSK